MNQIFQSFLALRLGMEEFFFLLQKRAVIPANPQQPIGIYAAEFRHLSGHILEKIAVMAYHYAGKGCFVQQSFEPLNSAETPSILTLTNPNAIRHHTHPLPKH